MPHQVPTPADVEAANTELPTSGTISHDPDQHGLRSIFDVRPPVPFRRTMPAVKITPEPVSVTPGMLVIEGAKVTQLGVWNDGRAVSLWEHDGKRRVVVGELKGVSEVVKEGVVVTPDKTVLLVLAGLVIGEETLEAFDGRTPTGRVPTTQPQRQDYPAPDQRKPYQAPASDEPDALRPNFKEVLSTKTYGQEVGFSCAFRQHRAHSHCRLLHGYALGFKFTFAATQFSNEGWVVDFGGLKGLKELLAGTFDHKVLVAWDDPMKDEILALQGLGVIDAVVVPATGCEAFARMVYEVTEQWLLDAGFSPRVRLVSVEVSEHGANSAIAQG